MSRIAGESELNTNRSVPWSEDVATAVKVYQAQSTCLVSRPLLASPANADVHSPRCGAADDNDKQQGLKTTGNDG